MVYGEHLTLEFRDAVQIVESHNTTYVQFQRAITYCTPALNAKKFRSSGTNLMGRRGSGVTDLTHRQRLGEQRVPG